MLVPTVSLSAIVACTDTVELITFEAPVDLLLPWETAAPAAAGVDPEALEAARSTLEGIPRSLSLLVAKDGRLIYEAYLHGNTSDSLNDVRSVTKSVVSTLVGVALREGFVRSLDQTVGELLPVGAATLPTDKASITIGNLLTMSGGFEWSESGASGYNEWITAPDQLGFLLARPIAHTPGTEFTYNSAAVHLLGVLLEGATGMSLPDFADDYLFGEIGITRSRWEPVSGGYVNGGAGIDLRPRDLLRLGQLALQDGVSGSTGLVADGWFEQAGTPRYSWRSNGPVLNSGSYGYLWWTENGRPSYAFLAWGYGGQFIYVVPQLNMVVVVTTDWRGVGSEVGALTSDVMRVIAEMVVPAAR